MARINVEDGLENYDPFRNLLRLLSKKHPDLTRDDIEDMARGRTIRFWRYAQKYWGDEMSLVPAKVIEREDLGIMIEAEMAEARSAGVYARGAEERFDWYLQKCNASRAAKRVRDEKAGKQIPNDREDDSELPEYDSRTTGTKIPDDRDADSELPESESRKSETENPDDQNTISESPSCSTLALALAPILTPNPFRNPEDEIPIPEEPRSSRSRGPDDSAIEAIMAALKWSGDDLKAATQRLSPRAIELLTTLGTGKYSEGLKIAWHGCRREPASGLSGDLFRDDAAAKVVVNLRRLARRLRSPKETS